MFFLLGRIRKLKPPKMLPSGPPERRMGMKVKARLLQGARGWLQWTRCYIPASSQSDPSPRAPLIRLARSVPKAY